jgi:DNA-binding NarL/FixJ family response regulator
MTTKILLADDHQIIRQGLKALLMKQGGLEVVAEVSNGHDAIRLAKELSPDIIVMDLSMPGLNGIDATRKIIEQNENQKVICLSAHADQRMATEMLKAGASGYVLKDAAFEELTIAINAVLKNNVYLSPNIAGLVVNGLIQGTYAKRSSPFSSISTREREVLQLVAEGKSTKEIAILFHVSVKTIETHRRNLMAKLKLDSVAELTKYAVREGLTAL